MFEMTYKSFIIVLPFICFCTAQVGERCTVSLTGASGVCKVGRDCPIVEKQAQSGIQPTLCGLIYNTIPIVCCEGATVSNVRPNENSFLDADNRPNPIVYPDDTSTTDLTISEKKCIEYNKQSVVVVEVLALLADAKPSSVNYTNCSLDGIGLIVGGAPASAGEFPFMAALGFNDGGTEILWNCGATLISDRYVMTAAHCANTLSFGPPVVVRLGDLNLKTDDDETEYEDFGISEITAHPNYAPQSKRNDIALIKLDRKVTFTKFIRPACLWNKYNIEYDSAIATGWGVIEDAGDQSDKLLKVRLDLFSNSRCNATYRNKHFPDGLPNSMLCAGVLQGGKDTCQGDSGGPLIVSKQGNQCIFYVLGITSFGKACAAVNTPAVYTRVSEFIPWIEKVVW